MEKSPVPQATSRTDTSWSLSMALRTALRLHSLPISRDRIWLSASYSGAMLSNICSTASLLGIFLYFCAIFSANLTGTEKLGIFNDYGVISKTEIYYGKQRNSSTAAHGLPRKRQD